MKRRAALVLALATLAPGCSARPVANDATETKPHVSLAVARAGSLSERVAAQGRVGPPAGSTAKLAFPEAGTVRTVSATVGESVRAGDVLATLDRAPLAAPLAQARGDALAADANYGGGAIPRAAQNGARAKLAAAMQRLVTLERGGPSASNDRTEAAAVDEQAALKVRGDELALARADELFAAGVVARKERDAAQQQLASDRAERIAAAARLAAARSDYASALGQARADVATDRADLEAASAQSGVLEGNAQSARGRLAAARVAYDNGVLAAPADGVVLSLLKHPGESVDPTTPVLEIGPQRGRGVTLTISADDAARVAIGDAVSYASGDAGAVPSVGQVLAIVPVVDRAAQVATVVASGGPAGALEGASLSASISVGSVRGILVPASAIVEDPQSGETVVFVYRAHPPKGETPFAMRAVTVRASDRTQAVLDSGIAPGDRIANEGSYLLLAPAGG